MRGTMIWFNAVKDHGYISTEDGDRFYVEGTAFAEGLRPKGRCAGLAVDFEVSETGLDTRVEEAALVLDVAPRRARLRHSVGRGRA